MTGQITRETNGRRGAEAPQAEPRMGATKVEREQGFFNKVYTESTRGRAWGFYDTTSASHEHFKKLVRGAHGLEGVRVLEIGMGLTCQAYWMAEEGAQVTGIDIADVAIDKGKQRAAELGVQDRCDFRVMDIENMTFGPSSFDLVCGNGAIHHVDVARGYENTARVLKAHGRAVWREPLGHNPLLNAFRRLTPRMRTEDEHPLVMDDLVLAKRWFDSVEARFFHLTTPAAIVFRNSRRFPAVLRTLERLDARLMPEHGRGVHRYAWFVVAQMVKGA